MLFPDIQQELLLDIETLQQTYAVNSIKLQSFIEAFEILKKVYPNTHLNKDLITQKINHMNPI